MLKLNQQTVRNWIDQGSLPALRVGRRVRIKRSDFDRILEEAYSGSADARRPRATEDRRRRGRRRATPSAEDFWGGEPVGIAEPATRRPGSDPATATAAATTSRTTSTRTRPRRTTATRRRHPSRATTAPR